MEVVKIVTELVDSNIYIVKNGKKGLLIDCGTYDVQNLEVRIKNADVEITDVLLTHGHFDHAAGAKALQEKGYKIYIHENDAEKLCTFKNMAVFMGFHFDKLKADVLLKGSETLNIAGLEIEVIPTPGHSAGSVCYKTGNVIFTGDTVFRLGYGRTDFPDGDFDTLKASINALFALEGDYKLYCGHYDDSTLSFERRNNPVLID